MSFLFIIGKPSFRMSVKDGSENPFVALFTSSVRQKARVATSIEVNSPTARNNVPLKLDVLAPTRPKTSQYLL